MIKRYMVVLTNDKGNSWKITYDYMPTNEEIELLLETYEQTGTGIYTAYIREEYGLR